MSFTFEVIDNATGEIVNTYRTNAVIIIPLTRKGKLNWKRWFMGFQDFFAAIAKDKELTLSDRRVFEYLLSIMDLDNYVSIPQDEIAKELGISVRTVQRAIEKLRRKNILLVRKVGKHNAYFLNPEAVWKGRIKSYKDKVLEFKLMK
jgi:biotin operon repressor